MKVLIQATTANDSNTGLGRYTLSLIRQFEQIQKPVELISYANRGVEIHTSFPNHKFKKLPSVANIPLQMWGEMRKLDFNLVHFPLHRTEDICAYSLIKKPKVLTIHDLIPFQPDPRVSGSWTGIKASAWKYGILRYARKMDAVITVSKNTKKDCVKYLGIEEEKVHAIPLAVDEIFKKCNETNLDNPYFIYAGGTASARKNVSTLIKAFQIFRNKGHRHQLCITGNIDPTIIKEIRNKRLNGIWLPGHVNDQRLAELYSGAIASIYPSLYEGFGFPVLESMACGCPVLTCTNSSLPEVAGCSALLIDPNSPKQIAEAMETILLEQGVRDNLISRGYRQAKEFSWEKCAEETWAVYESVMRS